MSDVTLAELAARMAVVEARLGITPPGPVLLPPATPGAPAGTKLSDGRWQLDWSDPGNVDNWNLFDLFNLADPLKETVTTPQSIRSAIKPGDRRGYALQANNAAGSSQIGPTLHLPPDAAPAPTPAPVPGVRHAADVFGPRFYLTIPEVDPRTGWAQEIFQPALASYDSKYLSPISDGTGAVFRCWHGGATTSGSKNPRSELREMADTVGKSKASWSATAGRHRMVVHGQVNRLTKVKPHVVIGQIHSATDDVTVFRVEGSQLWITNGNDPHGYLLDGNFALGQRYTIGFDVSGGVVSFTYNDKLVPYTVSSSSTSNYFKCGAYLQSNPTSAPSESTSEYTEVVIWSVDVAHS